MGLKAALSLAAVALAGVAYLGASEELADQRLAAPPIPDEQPTAAQALAEHFRVVLSGQDTSCHVTKGDGPAGQKARLIFAGCTGELADLASASFWTDQADGSVAFTGQDGRIAIRFAAGDGHAFESYGAGAPLVSLVAEGN